MAPFSSEYDFVTPTYELAHRFIYVYFIATNADIRISASEKFFVEDKETFLPVQVSFGKK